MAQESIDASDVGPLTNESKVPCFYPPRLPIMAQLPCLYAGAYSYGRRAAEGRHHQPDRPATDPPERRRKGDVC
jgi:hypothetical protein